MRYITGFLFLTVIASGFSAYSLTAEEARLADMMVETQQAVTRWLSLKAETDRLTVDYTLAHMRSRKPILMDTRSYQYYEYTGNAGDVFFKPPQSVGSIELCVNSPNPALREHYRLSLGTSETKNQEFLSLLQQNYPDIYTQVVGAAQVLKDQQNAALRATIALEEKEKAQLEFERIKASNTVALAPGLHLSPIALPSRMFEERAHTGRSGTPTPPVPLLKVFKLIKYASGNPDLTTDEMPVFVKLGNNLGFPLEQLRDALSQPFPIYDATHRIDGRYPVSRTSMHLVVNLFNRMKTGQPFAETREDQSILQNGLSGLIIMKDALNILTQNYDGSTQTQVGDEKGPEYRQCLENINVFVKKEGGEIVFESVPDPSQPPIVITQSAIEDLYSQLAAVV